MNENRRIVKQLFLSNYHLKRLMIFLGAGVSVLFGIPSLSDMTDTIYRGLTDENRDQIEIVRESLKSFGFSADIENVLTVLEAMKDPLRISEEIGPVVASFKSVEAIETVAHLPELIRTVKIQIRDLCSKPDQDKADTFFQNLWESLRRLHIFGGQNADLWSFAGTFVTTNYDLTFEDAFFHHLRHPVYDGFEHDSSKGAYVFKGNWPNIQQPPHKNLVKLHGSIDYYLQDSSDVIKDRAITSYGRSKPRHELLIYPAGGKSITTTPYYDLYWKFRDLLRHGNRALVLGFSFRDYAIRNIFSDWLSLNANAKLVIYSRSATKSKQLFPDTSIRDRIIARDLEFQTPDFGASLNDDLT
jgi:hypothetical protein